ncbi:MAG TPA: element excision factor XisI family protein [Urbifossiella sp.]|nr:element excision factor XisI family protein [Urbifossiella sp.]
MFFLRVRGGKVWVEEDHTDRPIAEELLRLGVPMEDIRVVVQ